jgi:hypothetical protein
MEIGEIERGLAASDDAWVFHCGYAVCRGYGPSVWEREEQRQETRKHGVRGVEENYNQVFYVQWS